MRCTEFLCDRAIHVHGSSYTDLVGFVISAVRCRTSFNEELEPTQPVFWFEVRPCLSLNFHCLLLNFHCLLLNFSLPFIELSLPFP